MDSKKKRTTVYIDPDVLEAAQDAGLNVSKTCENALIAATRALGGVYDMGRDGNRSNLKEWWAGPDLYL